MTRFIKLTGTGSLMTATVTTEDALALLRRAALDKQPVSGLTHRFYRYPARFSPIFARACIEAFSEPGDLVLDPYMGGGTTVVEAMVLGRQAVGSDINSLSVFVAQAKSSRLKACGQIRVGISRRPWPPRSLRQYCLQFRGNSCLGQRASSLPACR